VQATRNRLSLGIELRFQIRVVLSPEAVTMRGPSRGKDDSSDRVLEAAEDRGQRPSPRPIRLIVCRGRRPLTEVRAQIARIAAFEPSRAPMRAIRAASRNRSAFHRP
jgi:hypothetical protein